MNLNNRLQLHRLGFYLALGHVSVKNTSCEMVNAECFSVWSPLIQRRKVLKSGIISVPNDR